MSLSMNACWISLISAAQYSYIAIKFYVGEHYHWVKLPRSSWPTPIICLFSCA